MDIRDFDRILSKELEGKDQVISQQRSEKGSESAKPSTVDGARREIVRQLLSVLKLTDVNKEVIDSLTRSLSRDMQGIKTEVKLQDSSQSITDQTILNSKEIEKLLSSISINTTSVDQGKGMLSPKAKETLEQLHQSLKSILESIEKIGATPLPLHSPAPRTTGVVELGQLLEKISPEGRTVELKELKTFIADHIAHIRGSSPKAGIELLSTKSSHLLEPLIQTLRSIESRLQKSTDSPTKELHAFVKELASSLSALVSDGAKDSDIRKVLTGAQAKLSEQQEKNSPSPAITKEIANIRTQIDTLLSMKDIDLSGAKINLSTEEIARILPHITAIGESLTRIVDMLSETGDVPDALLKTLQAFEKLTPDNLKNINPKELSAIFTSLQNSLQEIETPLSTPSTPIPGAEFEKALRNILRDASGLRLLTELENVAAPEVALKHAANLLGTRISEAMQSASQGMQSSLLSSEASPMTLQILRNPELLSADPLLMGREQLAALSRTLEQDIQRALSDLSNQSRHSDGSEKSEKLSHAIKLTDRMVTATLELLNSEELSAPSAPVLESLKTALTSTVSDFKALTDAGMGNARILKHLIDLQLKLSDTSISKEELKALLLNVTGDISATLKESGQPEGSEGAKTAIDPRHTERLQRSIKTQPQRLEELMAGTKLDSQTLRELSTLKSVESMLQGQDLIRKLNPVMKMLGEPAFLLFPTLVQGLLTRTEISFFSSLDSTPEGGHKKRPKGGQGSYSCALMVLELPHFGKLGVHVAHRAEELLINFTTLDERVKNFIEPRLGSLTVILQGLGFSSPKITARSGEPQRATPEWIDAIAEASGVIA